MLMMIALFGIALITFAGNFGYDNDSNLNINNEGSFNSSMQSSSTEIENFYVDINGTAMPQYQESSAGSQVDTTDRGAIFKVTATSSMDMAKTTMQSAWNSIFGNDSGFGIILIAIFSLIGLTWILYSYKAWFGKNPD